MEVVANKIRYIFRREKLMITSKVIDIPRCNLPVFYLIIKSISIQKSYEASKIMYVWVKLNTN